MPAAKTLHYNPPTQGYFTRCGIRFKERIEWRKDLADVTCNNCIRLETQKPSEVIA